MTIQPINPEIVRAIVLDDCKVELSDMLSGNRSGRVVFARAIVATILHERAGMSYPEITRVVGLRKSSHSTTLEAHRRVMDGKHDSDATAVMGIQTTAREYAEYVRVRADEKSKVYHDDRARLSRLGDGPEKGAA